MSYGHDLLIRELAELEERLAIAREDVESLTKKVADIRALQTQLAEVRQA